MIVSNLKALEGVIWGTAIGDGLQRMSRFRDPPFLLHSATGTWFLSCLQAVVEKSELNLKLEVLTAPYSGLALRGSSNSLANTLIESATSRPSHKLVADLLPAITPLVFDPSTGEKLVQKIIDFCHVTHWHPRVLSSAALLIGALRTSLLEPSISFEEQLIQGEALSHEVLHELFERKEADTPQAIRTAHQAMKHFTAIGIGAKDAEDLQVPASFDGRDSPEKLVIYALALAQKRGVSAQDFRELFEQAGTSDILGPLIGGVVGFRHGLEAFPKRWQDLLEGKKLFERHINTMAQRDSYFPSLAESEIQLSRQEEKALKNLDYLQELSRPIDQLALFEEKVVKRRLART